ncbi:U-box domain-containing protein 11 [Linum perenne]
MAGGGNGPVLDHATPTAGLLLQLVRDIMVGGGNGCSSLPSPSSSSLFRKDCMDLVRRISLLTHFLEEIVDSVGESGLLDDPSRSWGSRSWCSALLAALHAAKRLLTVASTSKSSSHSDGAYCKIALQFRSVTCKLEKALGEIPFSQFNISEEVQEQVALVRSQLQRASERYRFVNADTTSSASAQQPILQNNRLNRSWKIEDVGCVNHDAVERPDTVVTEGCDADKAHGEISEAAAEGKVDSGRKSLEDLKKADAPTIPDDFLCPISLELMRDPVIVATGQTYERSFIQRWIDAGNMTCPKTQQKLQHSTLTPNYVLRSLIAQWCMKHNIEQPTGFTNNGRIKKITGDIAAIQAVVRKLSSRSIEERRAAVSEIRTLSKRSTDNRILIAEAGAIPVLVGLLTAEDVSIHENAVTSILNLSIHENNKGLIMLAGAIPSIVQVLRAGSVEAKENAAATLFSLSLGDENKIIIGASGAIPALVELLENGSTRGKKDAASALFNLCIYQGNKGRAVRAGIIAALLRMLTDSRSVMVDEALTILSVLSSNQEAKAAIVKASTIPILIDVLRTGEARSKENAASILLSLCKRDPENLGCISRLGAVIPLTELTKSGTERAKRKAGSLLDHIRKQMHPHHRHHQ